VRRLDKSEITEGVVAPGPAVPVGYVGHRIPFSVPATTTLPRIGELLDDIQSTALLHRATHLKVGSAGNSTLKIRTFTVNLESIAVDGTDTGIELPKPALVPQYTSLQVVFGHQALFQRRVPTKQLPVADASPVTQRKQGVTVASAVAAAVHRVPQEQQQLSCLVRESENVHRFRARCD